ncbi:MAG TPA: hypothetical protein VKZ83_12155 [Phototrophicaceae bacterium]|nr:hypothetical protein [Phototrophicaceae bacterium]
MSTPRRLGPLLAACALALAGCGATGGDTPDATPPAVASPEPTATTAAPTPTPTGEALADGTCAQLHAAVQGAKALAPEREPVLAALEAVTADVPAELADELGTVEEEVRAHLDEVVATEGFVDPVELDVPADLAAACAATGTDLADVPYPTATVAEICVELHRISQYQDLEGLDLVIDFSLRRARTYTPAEIEPGVRAFSDRMETVWDEERPPESAEDEAARLALGERCEQEGFILLQPS